MTTTEQIESFYRLGKRYICTRFPVLISDAEDIIQDVLIARWNKDRSVENNYAYFYTSIHNRCVDYTRKAKFQHEEPVAETFELETSRGTESIAVARMDAKERMARIQDSRRSDNSKRAIALTALGYTCPQVAEALGISLPAVKKAVLRGQHEIAREF